MVEYYYQCFINWAVKLRLKICIQIPLKMLRLGWRAVSKVMPAIFWVKKLPAAQSVLCYDRYRWYVRSERLQVIWGVYSNSFCKVNNTPHLIIIRLVLIRKKAIEPNTGKVTRFYNLVLFTRNFSDMEVAGPSTSGSTSLGDLLRYQSRL